MLIKKSKKRGELNIWACDICEKHFNVKSTNLKKQVKKKFCSKECYSKWSSKNASKKFKKFVKEKGGSQFRGGIGLTTDGYIWIRVFKSGRRRNEVKLHRYLMQIKLGRNLKPSEIVHHIDGNKLNNAIENLELTTISEHNKKHRHLCKENRDDIWSHKELKIIQDDNLSAKEKSKLINRTIFAIHQKRHRIKK